MDDADRHVVLRREAERLFGTAQLSTAVEPSGAADGATEADGESEPARESLLELIEFTINREY